jgi:hypothetical protein
MEPIASLIPLLNAHYCRHLLWLALPFLPEVRGVLRRERGVNVGFRMLRTPGISTHQSGYL